MDVFAKNVTGARVMVKDGFGNYWVSQPSQGTVTQLEMQSGAVIGQNAIFRSLRKPHGLAIDPASNGFDLYIAEEHRIVRARLYSDAPLEAIATLPTGGRHTTRSLGFGPDGRLYVSLGSTCDVCVEKNELAGTIFSMNKDGSDQKIVAKGLRNAVYFTWQPGTNALYATEMGRDNIGDAIPPDEVDIVKEGAHYGWPYCYSDRVRDPNFEPNTSFDCSTTEPPAVALPAHVAPLGLAFAPANWGQFAGDLLVAEHGSWNSSELVGYKIVHIPLSSNGTSEESGTDFITGWLRPNGSKFGRPAGLLMDTDGTLFITDDTAGTVYRVTPPAL